MIIENAYPGVIEGLQSAHRFIYWVPESMIPPTIHNELTLLAIVGNLVAIDNSNHEFETYFNQGTDRKAFTDNDMSELYSEIIYGIVTNLTDGMVTVAYNKNAIFHPMNASRVVNYMREVIKNMKNGEQTYKELPFYGSTYQEHLLVYLAHAQFRFIHDSTGYYSSIHVMPEPARSNMQEMMNSQGIDFTSPYVQPVLKHSNTIEQEAYNTGFYKTVPEAASYLMKNEQGFDPTFSRLPKFSGIHKMAAQQPVVDDGKNDEALKRFAKVLEGTREEMLRKTNRSCPNKGEMNAFDLEAYPQPPQSQTLKADCLDENGNVIIPNIQAIQTFFADRDRQERQTY